jgi:hypothetical protein
MAEDRIGGPDTAHVFDLAVLVLLPLPHRHDQAWRRFVRFRSLVPQVDQAQISQLDLPSALAAGDGNRCSAAVRR